jgi:hypothetical protein
MPQRYDVSFFHLDMQYIVFMPVASRLSFKTFYLSLNVYVETAYKY